jgi:hypothetical protein
MNGHTMRTKKAPPPAKRGPGAPTKRTPEVAERIFSAVRQGVPFTHAARLAGIVYSTFCEWRNTDAEFRGQLDAAISAGVEKRLKMIQNAADAGDWRAAEAWLRLVLPAEYGRQRLELTGENGAPLAAGVQIYLPRKDIGAVVETEPAATLALTEGSPDANGG